MCLIFYFHDLLYPYLNLSLSMCFVDRWLFAWSAFWWPLYCLSFFKLRFLLTPLGIFKVILLNCLSIHLFLYAI
jgi:hypothetical protein